jgi:hypothetical protein
MIETPLRDDDYREAFFYFMDEINEEKVRRFIKENESPEMDPITEMIVRMA